MKKIVFFLLVLFPICLLAQSFEEIEKKTLTLNRVKTKTQFVVSNVANGKTAEIDYTQSGDVKVKSSYSKKGVVTSTEKYEYDNNGNRIYYERTNQNGSYWKRSEYNAKNLLLEENGFDGSGNFHTIYSYNADGKPTNIVYRSNKIITEKRIYNHTGNTAIVEAFKGGTSLYAKIKLVYDEDNNILEETTLGLDGTVNDAKKYKYDENGLVITEEKFFKGNFIHRLIYEYDTNKRLINQYEETPDQKKFVEKAYVYNSKGQLEEYKWRRKATEEFNTKKYKYDDKNLCIEIDTFYPSTKFSITTGYEYEFF